MLPPARGPAFWMALLLVGLTAWVGCTAFPSATASTPTPAPPTATRAPATASPAPIFTATATARPTPVPLAVELAATLIAPYAPDYEPHQTPDGLWHIRFTTPEGQAVELQDVRAEGRSMEPQDWVENYNHGQVLFEGTAEDGTLWRIVEQNGERMLMWQQRTPLRMDAFPYWWWGGGPEGKAEIVLPGNGQLEWLTITRTDEKDEEGHTIWVNKETGEPVPLSEMGYMYVEKILPKQGQPVPTEMKLPVVVLTDWQVQALEAKDGHEYVVREGKVWVDGQEVTVPETKTPAEPESLMFNSKDSQWYLGWQGIALWQVKDGGVVKYDRPVWMTRMYLLTNNLSDGEVIERWNKNTDLKSELDYMNYIRQGYYINNVQIPFVGVMGGIESSSLGNKTMYILPGIIVDKFEGRVGMSLAVRHVNPFEDFIFTFSLKYYTNMLEEISDGEILSEDTEGVRVDLVDKFRNTLRKDEPIPAVFVYSDDGAMYMGAKLYDGSVIMPLDEAEELQHRLEENLLKGVIDGDQEAFLGKGQHIFISGNMILTLGEK